MIHILTPYRGEATTGGLKYNFVLHDCIEQICETEDVIFFTDLDFPKARVSLFYNIWYLKLLFKTKPAVLLFDSRMFPRLFLFLFVYKLFSRKTKIVATLHHYQFLARENKKLAAIDKVLERMVLNLCDEIIVPSPYTLDLTKQFFSHKQLTYIPLGFEKRVLLDQEGISGVTNLLFVGTICARKGVHHFIDVMTNLINKNFILHVVGGYNNDSYYKRLRASIEEKGLSKCIKFHGRLSDDELNQIFQKSQIFTFPTHYEGFGMVMAEALSYGLPVICFNNSAIPYLIKDQYNGYILNEFDTSAFVEKIKDLSGDNKLYNQMSNNALKSFKNLESYPKQVSNMKKWAKELKKNFC